MSYHHPTAQNEAEPSVDIARRRAAARRLAAGDPLVMAAARANMRKRTLQELMCEDEFNELVEAYRPLQEMSATEWRKELESRLRDAIEDALEDRRISTLNLLLRSFDGLLSGGQDGSAMVRQRERVLSFLVEQSDEGLAEYLSGGSAEMPDPSGVLLCVDEERRRNILARLDELLRAKREASVTAVAPDDAVPACAPDAEAPISRGSPQPSSRHEHTGSRDPDDELEQRRRARCARALAPVPPPAADEGPTVDTWPFEGPPPQAAERAAPVGKTTRPQAACDVLEGGKSEDGAAGSRAMRSEAAARLACETMARPGRAREKLPAGLVATNAATFLAQRPP